MYSSKAYDQLPACYRDPLPDSMNSTCQYAVPDSCCSPIEPGEIVSEIDSATIELYRSYYLQLAQFHDFEQLKEFIDEHELPPFESIFPDEVRDYEANLMVSYQSFCSADHEVPEYPVEHSAEPLSDEQPYDYQSSENQPSDDQPSDDQPSDDQPSDDQPSDDQFDCSSDVITELSELDSPKSSPEDLCETDYAYLDETSAERYAFDPEVAYRDAVRSPNCDDPYDLLLDLNHGVCSSSISWRELKRIIESTERIYDRLNGKLKKLKYRMCGQSNQISTLKRVVLRMQFHQKKLKKLGQNVSGKIACYRNSLESNSYDPHAQRIQLLIDRLYNPFHEFSALIQLQLPTDGLVDAGHMQLVAKLQSNLERLCSIRKELKSISSAAKLSLGRRDRLIEQLRPAIVRDVLNIYHQLLAEEYDHSSVVGGYRQECTARSFYKLLTTIY